MSNVEHINRVIEPALAIYRAEIRRHQYDYDAPTPRCECGWEPKAAARRNQNIAVGQHVRWAMKRADRAFDQASGALIHDDLWAGIRGQR